MNKGSSLKSKTEIKGCFILLLLCFCFIQSQYEMVIYNHVKSECSKYCEALDDPIAQTFKNDHATRGLFYNIQEINEELFSYIFDVFKNYKEKRLTIVLINNEHNLFINNDFLKVMSLLKDYKNDKNIVCPKTIFIQDKPKGETFIPSPRFSKFINTNINVLIFENDTISFDMMYLFLINFCTLTDPETKFKYKHFYFGKNLKIDKNTISNLNNALNKHCKLDESGLKIFEFKYDLETPKHSFIKYYNTLKVQKNALEETHLNTLISLKEKDAESGHGVAYQKLIFSDCLNRFSLEMKIDYEYVKYEDHDKKNIYFNTSYGILINYKLVDTYDFTNTGTIKFIPRLSSENPTPDTKVYELLMIIDGKVLMDNKIRYVFEVAKQEGTQPKIISNDLSENISKAFIHLNENFSILKKSTLKNRIFYYQPNILYEKLQIKTNKKQIKMWNLLFNEKIYDMNILLKNLLTTINNKYGKINHQTNQFEYESTYTEILPFEYEWKKKITDFSALKFNGKEDTMFNYCNNIILGPKNSENTSSQLGIKIRLNHNDFEEVYFIYVIPSFIFDFNPFLKTNNQLILDELTKQTENIFKNCKSDLSLYSNVVAKMKEIIDTLQFSLYFVLYDDVKRNDALKNAVTKITDEALKDLNIANITGDKEVESYNNFKSEFENILLSYFNKFLSSMENKEFKCIVLTEYFTIHHLEKNLKTISECIKECFEPVKHKEQQLKNLLRSFASTSGMNCSSTPFFQKLKKEKKKNKKKNQEKEKKEKK